MELERDKELSEEVKTMVKNGQEAEEILNLMEANNESEIAAMFYYLIRRINELEARLQAREVK